MNPRQQLRFSTLPGLYGFGRKPSVAPTTTFEISDQDIGLKSDPVAQEIAERYVRAAIAYRTKQAERAETDAKARRAQIAIAAEELRIDLETAEGIVAEITRLAAYRTTALEYASH